MIDVEGIACKSARSQTIFSLDEDEEESLLVSVDVGNKLVILVTRAFLCTDRLAKNW